MEYMPQVKVSKEDFLALSDLAGDMSIMDYMSKVIRDHVAAQQSVQRTAGASGSPELFPAEVIPSAKVTRQSTRR